MADLYLPKERETPFNPSVDDSNYARAFCDLARILDATTQSEAISLRLSTCRNVYMTVNSLFGVIREILGKGKEPSYLDQALNLLGVIVTTPEGEERRKKRSELDGILHEIGLRMKAFADKQFAWTKRFDLDRTLQETVKGALDRIDADRLMRILHNCRAHQDGKPLEDAWDSRWLEWTQEDGSEWAADRLATVERDGKKIGAIVHVIRAVAGLLDPSDSFRQPTLFQKNKRQSCHQQDTPWTRLHKTLRGASNDLGLALNQADDGSVAWHVPGNGECLLPPEPPPDPQFRKILSQLIELLKIRSLELYESFTSTFRPNLGRTPLPPPYSIDLSDAFAIKGPTHKLADVLGRVEVRDYGRSAPALITVALCQFGVPLAYYGSRLGRYASDDKKKEIEKIAKAALDVVSSSPNPVLVLPELFLPASCADEVGQYARDRKTALIAGVEYLESIEGPINQALISLPHLFVNVMQVKTRSSPDEVRFAYESSGVYILGGTDIGSFAVVVCSDFREFDLLAAIANAPFLIDTLFVCSYNSKPELFESFAISDAARLYCHVVIGNGCWDVNSPNTGSSRGSTVCSPLADPAKQKLAPSRVVPLALPPVGGVSPAIALFELRIGELRSDKDKPTGGYLNAPYFRRPIPYPIARA